MKHKPSLLICGSRGSQVTIGLVWRHYWRGPTIVINGGCLTSETLIPAPVFPVMITMTGDYFGTKSLDFVQEKFAAVSDTGGVQIHLLGQGHMPRLEPTFFAQVVQCALTGTAMPPSTNYSIHQLQPAASYLHLHQTGDRKYTLLRSEPSSDNGALLRNPQLPNGQRLRYLEFQTDEKGFGMVHVSVQINDVEYVGWTYCKNIAEFK